MVRIRGESRVAGAASYVFLNKSSAVSCQARHVVASLSRLTTTFFLQKQVIVAYARLAPPFRNPLRYSGSSRAFRA